jgi:hypothetical protein
MSLAQVNVVTRAKQYLLSNVWEAGKVSI